MNEVSPILPGILRIPADLYHRDPAPTPSLSSTLARLIINRSPLHAWTASARLNPDWQSDHRKTFDIGRAAHRALLGAGEDFAAIPEDLLASNGAASTKEAKAFIADCRDRGVTPLKESEVDGIGLMVETARDRLAAMGITLDPDRSEIVALAEIDGVWCRAMVDNAPSDPSLPLYDFKTTENAAPEACMRSIMSYGYDVQAAHYLDTWRAATGEDRRFRFIFQEKSAPFEVCVVELHDDSLTMGCKRVKMARQKWAWCLRNDRWPGYPLGVQQVQLPEFYQAAFLERESVEADYRRRFSADILELSYRMQAPAPAAE